MQITPHFTWEEMTATSTGLDNHPDAEARENLELTAAAMEEVRSLLGHPIYVNSGYRSPEVNAAVGGSVNSAHMSGWACDFTCAAFGTPLVICHFLSASVLDFDQLIQEGTWVHLGFGPGHRREVLTKRPDGTYKQGL